MFSFKNLLSGIATKLGIRLQSNAVIASHVQGNARASLKRRRGISSGSAKARMLGALPDWFFPARLRRVVGPAGYDYCSPQQEINILRRERGYGRGGLKVGHERFDPSQGMAS